MKYLSFDVGIKNLAYCYIETPNKECPAKNADINILKWDIINLTSKHETSCFFTNCNKPVKYQINNIHSCKRHASKHDTYFENSKKLCCTSLKKMPTNELRLLCDHFNLSLECYKYKTKLISSLSKHVKHFSFKPYKKPNSNTIDIIEIGKNINHYFDLLFNDCEIDTIVIENQIGSIAARMKTIQGMIAQYFIIKNPTSDIHFLSSHNKLKFFPTEKKLSYKERKLLSISKTRDLVNDHHVSWCDFFQNNKKQDDLADCFLQCIIFLRLT